MTKSAGWSKARRRAVSVRVTAEYTNSERTDVSGLFLEVSDSEHHVLRADRIEYDPPRPLTLSEQIEATQNRLQVTMRLSAPLESFEFLYGGAVLFAHVKRVKKNAASR